MRLVFLLSLGVLAAPGCGGDKTIVLHPGCPPGQVQSRSGECIPEGSCIDDDDCEEGSRCRGGACVSGPDDSPCANDDDCLQAELCSVRERCIPVGTCFGDEDCREEGDVCTARNVCLPEGTCEQNGDCPEGHVCESGVCEIGGECGETRFELEVAPNLLILLDRSGSMNEEIDGVSKWQIAVNAVTATIGDYGAAIRFGLAIFSNCDGPLDRCNPGVVEVPCGPGTVDEIIRELGAAERCGSTPIASSLDGMLGEASIQAPDRENAILLITDGRDSCGGDPSPEAAALLAQAIPVETYVVGFGSGVNPTELAETATEGGTALAGDPVYYQVDGAGALDAALADVASRVLGCTYPLAEVPPDPDLINVFFNGAEEVPRDPDDGWEYDPDTNSVTFHGAACDRLRAGEVTDLDVVFGCPSDVE